MRIRDELAYIANSLEGTWHEWQDGDISDAFFSETLRKKIEEMRELRQQVHDE